VNSGRSRFVKFNSAALAILTTLLLVSGGASAKDHKLKTSDNQADVVAHISFTGLSAVDMAIQKKVNDKYYLYVQHSKDQGISIIDITKPAQPKVVGAIPWPDPAVSSRVNVTGDLAIISERTELTTCPPAQRPSAVLASPQSSTPMNSVAQLRSALYQLQYRDPVLLQVERQGKTSLCRF